MKPILALLLALFVADAHAYTRQDTLRGSNGRGRSWWDVQRYDLTVALNPAQKSISGTSVIAFTTVGASTDSLQLDLQAPLQVDSITLNGQRVAAAREGQVFWVNMPRRFDQGERGVLSVWYHGRPREAVKPPWDGGLVWTKDGIGKPWTAVACQGLGASVWWPCKDYQGDEPDSGMTLNIPSVPYEQNTDRTGSPKFYSAVSNGRPQRDTTDWAHPETGEITRLVYNSWNIRNPINSYDATFYIGDYVSWTDTFQGAKGTLDLSFHCLRPNEAKARKQFAVTKEMLRCFEWWFGPYPFYEDGYKLVEAPYLGMEHQSAVAYGNKYQMGYLGRDRSSTGVGLLFDYIIIHESGHEWFGNSITAQDVADNWIHEGFTTYSETLFAEWIAGKDAARRYSIGERQNIGNDKPIIGAYDVNDDGSGDKYDKGAAILHMIRTMMANDEAFRQTLRGLNDTFYHKIVTTAQVEAYIARRAGRDLASFFQQYLRTTQIPVLQWYRKDGQLYTRFVNAVDGFTVPVAVTGKDTRLVPVGTAWASVPWKGRKPRFGDDYLMMVEETAAR